MTTNQPPNIEAMIAHEQRLWNSMSTADKMNALASGEFKANAGVDYSTDDALPVAYTVSYTSAELAPFIALEEIESAMSDVREGLDALRRESLLLRQTIKALSHHIPGLTETTLLPLEVRARVQLVLDGKPLS